MDAIQFSTYLHCAAPRIRCKTHGVKTVSIAWVGKNSRFTLLFEAFAIRVLKAARGVEEARKLLSLNWHQVDAIKARAVERGLAHRAESEIPTWVLMKNSSAVVIVTSAASMTSKADVC